MMKKNLILKKWRIPFTLAVLTFLTFSLHAQSITGKVTDENGNGLIGVNIIEKGTTNGTITDMNGNYNLTVLSDEAILKFSSIGYQTQEIAIAGRTSIDLQMQVSMEAFDEVVVVGYGTMKKSDLTGAVGSVKSEELTQLSTVDAVQAMQGRVAGVNVISNSGEPGAGVKIRIRGTGTINNSDPLFVVDGFPVDNISFLAPNDISSIEILKDASATAIYGSRGANGVVLVSTKKGKAGKAQVEINAYSGFQHAWRTIPMANAWQYATSVRESFANNNAEPDPFLRETFKYVIDNQSNGTNWQDEVLRTGYRQNYNLSISGGSEAYKYMVSGSYYDERGIVKNTEMQKYIFHLNNDFKVSDRINAGVSLAYSYYTRPNYNSDLYNGVLTGAIRRDPIGPAWSKLENNWGRQVSTEVIGNPARAADFIKYTNQNGYTTITNAWAEISLLDGLKFNSRFSYDRREGRTKNYSPKFYVSPVERYDVSTLYESTNQGLLWTVNNYFNYTKEFGPHSINAMVGMEAQSTTWQTISATVQDVALDKSLQFLSAAKGTDPKVYGDKSEYSLLSYMGRLNYSFMSRYLFTGTVRWDGSSKFLDDNKWGLFPSFSVAWNAKNESFLQDIDIISILKIRGGWGSVGNEGSVGNYAFVTTVEPNQTYVFNDEVVPGLAPVSLSNPGIKWESQEQVNVGFDLSVLQNRLSFTADYFIKRTNDMLYYRPVPSYVGAGSPFDNVASMENKGFEISLDYRNYESDFKYDFNFNMAFIENEVTSLGTDAAFIERGLGKITGAITRTEEGKEVAYFYGFKTDGIINTPEELNEYKTRYKGDIVGKTTVGDIKFVDANGDSTINDNDRVNLGSGNAPFTFGFSAGFDFKGFDLKLFFQGVYGNEIANSMIRFIESPEGLYNISENYFDNRWTPDATDATMHKLSRSSSSLDLHSRFSDRYVEDGSYIRLKNLQLGYTLPERIMSKSGMGNLRIYLSADNLLTFTKYKKGWDPEIYALYGDPLMRGVDLGTYPVNRSFIVGLTLNF